MSDDSGSDFHVNLEDSDAEGEDDDASLKTYVRRSYWNHLLQCIVHNYNIWVNSSAGDEKCSVTDLTMIASYLEHKAMRACMMANVYQQYMATMIKEIKQSSRDKKPYRNLIEHLSSIKLKWSNKETQTEQVAGSQISSANLAASQVSRENLKSKFRIKKAKETLGVEPLTNILNLTSDSIQTCSIDDIIHSMAADFRPLKPSGKPENEENIQVVSSLKRAGKDDNSKNDLSTLDERLSRFSELFGDEPHSEPILECDSSTKLSHEVPDGALEDKRVLNWNLEMIAQTCHVNQILLNLPPTKKAKLETRYKDLFGSDNDCISHPSSGEIAKCRKRTADLVVQELSPYYVDCRIASREIFKLLARTISRVIMQKTYAPEPMEVKEYVTSLFASGRSFLLSGDVMSLN